MHICEEKWFTLLSGDVADFYITFIVCPVTKVYFCAITFLVLKEELNRVTLAAVIAR
jgi:hypothetical protein